MATGGLLFFLGEGYMKRIYEISNYYINKKGDVFSDVIMPNSKKRWNFKKMSQWKRNGYLCVSLDSRNYYVHNLLLKAFIKKRPKGYQCRHMDGNKLNNNLSNLVWGTAKENQADRLKHGTDNRGSHHPQSKYSDLFVRSVKLLCKTKQQKDVAKLLNMPKSTVSYLVVKRMETPI